MTDNQYISTPKLLVYIPCHKDFEMAYINARKIADQVTNNEPKSLDVQIVISINGVENFRHQQDIPFTQISYMQTVLGADANIAKGFVTALEIQPDYLWILSANEDLVENAISNLSKMIQQNLDTDLFVTNAAGRHGDLSLSSVFLDVPPNLALGLISGVIYKFSSTKNSFLQSTLFSWTGWGHLSVIQNFLSTNAPNRLIEFPDSFLYEKPYTFTPLAGKNQNEREIVKNLYSHSFFGLPVLAYCMLQNDPSSLKRYQAMWLRLNWYKLDSFSKKATIGDEMRLQRSVWIRAINKQSFKKFIRMRALYFLSSCVPASKLENNRLAARLLEFYKRFA